MSLGAQLNHHCLHLSSHNRYFVVVMSTNVTNKVLKEIQDTISFAILDSPLIKTGGDDMKNKMMWRLLSLYTCGEPSHKDILTFPHQFLNGMGKFQGIWNTESSSDGESITHYMNKALHRSQKFNLVIGEGSLTIDMLNLSEKVSDQLKKKSMDEIHLINGRTMHERTKSIVTNCRKMLSLVIDDRCPYKDPDKFPSGKTWENYAKWCIDAFWREKEGKTIFPVDDDPGE